jgi:hypothetical protein
LKPKVSSQHEKAAKLPEASQKSMPEKNACSIFFLLYFYFNRSFFEHGFCRLTYLSTNVFRNDCIEAETPFGVAVAALRGVAIQRGRVRGYPAAAAAAAAAAFARHPSPFSAATALHGYTP